MASALIVETGAGIADANSYDTADNLRAYALLRGVVLAPDDAAGELLVDQMAIKAMDFIEANRTRWLGWKTTATQALSFPRTGIVDEPLGDTAYVVNGYENLLTSGLTFRDQNVIPREIKAAQAVLMMQVFAGVVLQPTIAAGKFVTREKIGPIETSFSEAIGHYLLPEMPMVDALFHPFLRPSPATRAYRV